MANDVLTEKQYQAYILERLSEQGYTITSPKGYSREYALEPESLFSFLYATQSTEMEALAKVYKDQLHQVILAKINAEETKAQGSRLQVLKHGIDISHHHLDLMYTRPATDFNLELSRLYRENRFTAAEEVYASDEERIDIVIYLNGLAIVAIELKCNAAGQSYHDAICQFRQHRSPDTRLFLWKAGVLVSFAMDLEEAYMTTRLAGEATFFLPFNQGRGEGIHQGAGNPIYPDKYSTCYMWEDVLTKDTLLDIIAKFMFIESKETVDPRNGKTITKENIIFPRYHQLDCLRKVLSDVAENRCSQNYLIQHSAGSGKTNTIAWLSHRLASLHDGDNKIIFDNIIICTDRVVVDRQLQRAILAIEHKDGMIRVMDDRCTSADLATALQGNTKIIATTIQKFPYIVDTVKGLSSKHFAVIIDEAHSSTAGKNMAAITRSLGSSGTGKPGEKVTAGAAGTAGAGRATEVESVEEGRDMEDLIAQEIASQGKQANVAMFAFTATPKASTLQIFGREDIQGHKAPFHLYSMKQAIEEGFILDVLQNYITYDTYFRLNKAIREDPELRTSDAKGQIARFVQLHEVNIAQRVEIIVEHFRTTVMGELEGTAKAMVVTESRAGAVRYRQAFQEYVERRGYPHIRALVAFSGKVTVDDVEYTESGMNGFSEKNLPSEFAKEDYQVLLVADKYQVGFDQPRLCGMYILKKLQGVAAVQTLSRLNRICPPYDKKTFVLDFANDYEDIAKAFGKYYAGTLLANTVTPAVIYDMMLKLEGYYFLNPADVEDFNKVLYRQKHTASDKQQLTFYLQKAHKAIEDFPEEKGMRCIMEIRHFVRFYEFLLQASCFEDVELHKKYNFLDYLESYLKINHPGDGYNLEGKLKATEFQQKVVGTYTGTTLQPTPVKPPNPDPPVHKSPKLERLSQIIRDINSRTGHSYDEDVATKAVLQVVDMMKKSETLRKKAQNNQLKEFELAFYGDDIDDILDACLEQNQEFYGLLMDNSEVKHQVLGLYVAETYDTLRGYHV